MSHPLIKKDELISIWDSLEKQVLEKYQKRNEHLFDRETDRINRYFDDYPLKVENRIRKLDEEKKEINRRRDNSSDLEERRILQKKLQDITVSMDRVSIGQLKLKQEAARLRQKELESFGKN